MITPEVIQAVGQHIVIPICICVAACIWSWNLLK